MRDENDAREIVQEAFLRVYRGLASFEGGSTFFTWLYRIVSNLAIDAMRKPSRRESESLDAELVDDGVDQPLLSRLDGADPLDVVRRGEIRRRIEAALDALPSYHRGVILMREVEGMSYEEMAEAMGVSKGTIMSRLFHARRKLQRAFAECYEEQIGRPRSKKETRRERAHDERLMRYFDGELDAAEAREVEPWLEGSEDGKLLLLAWGRVGDAVRAIGDDAGAAGATIADAVMARIGLSPKPVAVFATRPRGARRWMAAAPAIGLSLAAAAAVAFYLRPAPPPSGVQERVPVARAPDTVSNAAETASALAVAVAEPETGASIESVDFGAIGGTIFMVSSGQSSDDSETPVVWLMDEPPPTRVG